MSIIITCEEGTKVKISRDSVTGDSRENVSIRYKTDPGITGKITLKDYDLKTLLSGLKENGKSEVISNDHRVIQVVDFTPYKDIEYMDNYFIVLSIKHSRTITIHKYLKCSDFYEQTEHFQQVMKLKSRR